MASSSGAPAAPSARKRGPSIATPPLDTSSAAKTTKRYSYSDTPMEMQAPKFNYPKTSPTNSTIDESPISPDSPASRYLPIYAEPATTHALVREEKERAYPQEPPRSQDIHPAYFAPYREESQRQQRGEQQQQQQNPQHQPHAQTANDTMPSLNITAPTPQSPTSAPHSLSALPPPLPNGTDNSTHLRPSQYTKPYEPKKSPQAAAPAAAMTGTATSIVPDTYPPPPATTNPTAPTSTSITPNSQHWRHNLCDPSPVCCLSLFLPCLVYGKTQYRLNRKSNGEDATNLLGYEACNGACGLFVLACGLQGLLAALQRNRVRKAYQIEGDVTTDCVKGVCCCCCVVGQDEREMKTREEERRDGVGAAGAVGGAYVSPSGGMMYAPPPKVAR